MVKLENKIKRNFIWEFILLFCERNKIVFPFLFLIFFLSTSVVFAQGDYYDQFNTVSYANNDGTLNFSANWVETGDGGTSPSTGWVRITGNRLRLRNLDNRTIRRTLDLSTATNVNLTFTYDANNRGNETVLVQLWNNATSSWDTVSTLNTTTTGTVSHTLTTNQISAASAIRFIGGDNSWSNWERIFIDDVRFITSLPNTPPTLTATGTQNYCPGSSTINIATTVSITDPDDVSTSAIYIQISSGYVNGEDLLALDNLATHSANGITSSWDAVQGELTLAGPATYTDFEAAILDVLYSSSSGTATGVRQFSITVGEANYLPSTGHYYEYVSDLGITWTAAETAAASRTHFGLQGYLATLTNQVEADFAGIQAVGVGWIGANDVASEGVWRWATGPEAGNLLGFSFWNAGEPNDAGSGEDYAHITHADIGPPGTWNDLANAGSTCCGDHYFPQGYVVEYGGTVGDPVLNITAITQVTLVCTADLSLTKIVDNASPDQGDTITFTLTISNAGPSAPTNIIVKDILPVGFTYTSFSTTQGAAIYTLGTRTLEWNLDTGGAFVLASGSSITLTYTVTVDVCGEFVNQAEITNSSLTDPDSTVNSGG